MAKVLVVLTAFACILLQQSELAASLQCYACTGPLNSYSDCENLLHVQPSTCGAEEVCASFVLQKSTREILHRTCASNNICSILETQYQYNPAVTVRACNVCDQDNCNSAPA